MNEIPQSGGTLFETVSCNLCGAEAYDVVLESTLTDQDLSASADTAVPGDSGIRTPRIVRCRQCGLCYANPRPKGDFLRLLYSRTSDPDVLSEASHKIRTARFYLKRMRRLSIGNRLLEIGCYTGFFLKAAEETGWKVAGIEPSEWASRYARETLHLSVTTGLFEETDFPPESFDAIVAFQVLEHVADPRTFLMRLSRLLVPGGLLVVEVPDIGSMAARLLTKRWWMLKPVHLYYFSRQTLARSLQETGFRVVWQGTAVNRFSLGHLAKRLKPYGTTLSTALSKTFGLLRLDTVGIPLNLGDLTVIFATKGP